MNAFNKKVIDKNGEKYEVVYHCFCDNNKDPQLTLKNIRTENKMLIKFSQLIREYKICQKN